MENRREVSDLKLFGLMLASVLAAFLAGCAGVATPVLPAPSIQPTSPATNVLLTPTAASATSPAPSIQPASPATPVPLTPTAAAAASPAGALYTPAATALSSPTAGSSAPSIQPTSLATPIPQTPTAAPAASMEAQNTPPGSVVDDLGESTAGQAVARLQDEGLQTTLIIVSANSTGVELEIYQDMRQRMIRGTAGPDEGIDTRSQRCYPYCVFIPFEERNALSVDAWVLVLRHEYRHMVQAVHNPTMASDYRVAGGGFFTTYAAFSEACADYGLNVSTLYHAQERIDQLKAVVGAGMQALIDQACLGDTPSYDKLALAYNQNRGSEPEFAELFPPYP
jgi:hypothetical protein